MTSQRFLNDKVNSRDFLRSLKDACLAPLIAIFFLSYKYIAPLASFAKTLRNDIMYKDLLVKREIISYFGGTTNDEYYYTESLVPIIMIFCGMFMALTLFNFAFKKKSVNVYFSMGITRTRLFVNRILAGALEIFAATVIPLFITFIVNVTMFGYNVHQLKLFAYYTFLMFTCGMAGLVIGAFAASVSGSIIEMVITSASTSGIAIAAAAFVSGLKELLLRGFVGSDEGFNIFLLSPWTALVEKSMANRLITGEKVPKDLLITWKADVFPIVLWVVISVAVCALGLFLFKKRKNENSNSFGKFDVSSAVNGVMVFLVAALGLMQIFEDVYGFQIHSIALCILIGAVGTVVAFIVAELIMRRNIKAVLRMLPVLGGAALFAIVSLAVIGTGYFGTYNKLPEAKDIEYVSMSYNDPLGIFNYETYCYHPEEYDNENITNLCKSSNPEDIKLCMEQFNKIKDAKQSVSFHDNYYIAERVNFVIKTKDGKFMTRSFPVYSEDLIHDYSKAVFNSDYFHTVLKYNLDSFSSGMAQNEIMYDQYVMYEYDMNYSGGISYFDGSLLTDNYNYDYGTLESSEIFDITEELKDALYNDLCKMTYDEYYGKGSETVGAIVWDTTRLHYEAQTYVAEYDWVNFYNNAYYSDGYYYEGENKDHIIKSGVAYTFIPVYPQMTETLEQLKDFDPNPHKPTVKAVIYPDKMLSMATAVNNIESSSRRFYYDNVNEIIFVSGHSTRQDWLYSEKVETIFAEKTKGNYLDFMEIVYNANDTKLTRVDDAQKAKKISDASRMVYDTYGDNGRYVYVIYDDGTIVPKYLPEKSLSVLN